MAFLCAGLCSRGPIALYVIGERRSWWWPNGFPEEQFSQFSVGDPTQAKYDIRIRYSGCDSGTQSPSFSSRNTGSFLCCWATVDYFVQFCESHFDRALTNWRMFKNLETMTYKVWILGCFPLSVTIASFFLHSSLEAIEKYRGVPTIIFIFGKTTLMDMVWTSTI